MSLGSAFHDFLRSYSSLFCSVHLCMLLFITNLSSVVYLLYICSVIFTISHSVYCRTGADTRERSLKLKLNHDDLGYIAVSSQHCYCETALQLTDHGHNDVCSF